MDRNEEVDLIEVSRLAQVYDPWEWLGCDPFTLEDLDLQGPRREYHGVHHERDDQYHRQRVATFINDLQAGKKLDPLEIDNKWVGMTPVDIMLLDGHHRLIAAILGGETRIACSYSGVVDLLEWLKGAGDPHRPPLG